MIMEDSDWSKKWDKADKNRQPIPTKWKNFIAGFIMGGFVIVAVMYSFDTLMRWMLG